jgi:glycerophosphoryl diester phosphodiesterase
MNMNIFGHRGAKGVAMENSLQGFLLAISQGINQFELDVRLSSDKQLMVVHDEKLLRLANSSLSVSKSTAQVLSQTLLNGTQEGIPTLEEVIAACPCVTHWQFEIKTLKSNADFVAPMKYLIDKYQLQDKVTITSKHIGTLEIFKHNLEHIKRGYVQEWPRPNGIKTAIKLNCHMLALNKNLAHRKYIKKAQAQGLHVSVWTVNLQKDIQRLHDLQVDSIISDVPQLAVETLKKPLI